MTPSIAVIGTGPVARALTAAYAAGGGRVVHIVSRDARRGAALAGELGAGSGGNDLERALTADVVMVAVADRAIAEVGARIVSTSGATECLWLHTSGALPGAALAHAPLRTGSLHPLQTFVERAGAGASGLAALVPGAHWFHEGEGAAEAAQLVEVWRGALHRLAPGGKVLYHAGAAVLSNHTVALFDAALRLFAAAGVPVESARAPLVALLEGTLRNLAAVGVPQALTGPVARGDVETVRRHVIAIRGAAPELLPSYVEMARRAAVVARAKGTLTPEAAAELDTLLARA